MAELNKSIGKRLRKHRRLMGFSQTDVARRLGLANTAIISRWERGVTMPSMESAMNLSKLYKTLLNELFWDLDRHSGEQLFPEEAKRRKGKLNNRDP